MFDVSPLFKAESEKAFRNEGYIKMSFGIVDPDAQTYSEFSDNGHLTYSSTKDLDFGLTVPQSYQTLEPNRFVLDGKNILLPEDPIYQGYVGNELSDDEGFYNLNNYPLLTVTFSQPISFSAITFSFDVSNGDYPKILIFRTYLNGKQVFSNSYNPDKAEDWVLSHKSTPVDKIEITFLRSNTPMRRPRINYIIWGEVKKFNPEDILTATYKHSTDLLSLSLPEVSFDFTIFDTSKSYDPDNPDTLWNYLESNQPVIVQYGFGLDDGSIEWIPMCTNYTTGDVGVSSQGVATELTFTTSSILEQMNDVYDEGMYYPNGRSIYDLIQDVMVFYEKKSDRKSPLVDIDASLKNIKTKNPLPKAPIKQCLQLLANMGMCVFDIKRNGTISIIRLNEQMQDFSFDFSKMLEPPNSNKVPVVRYINSNYTNYTEDDKISELAKVDLANTNNTSVTIAYSTSINQSYTTTGNLTVSSIKFYAQCCKVVCSGSGKLIVKGTKMESKKVDVNKKFNELGTDAPIENELLDNYETTMSYIDWVFSILNLRNTYSFNNRGYLELDAGDRLMLDSNFATGLSGYLIENSIEYNGAFTGSSKVIV